MLRIVPLAEAARDAVETLLDAAFGADRHTRTAYRLREGCTCLPALSFAGYDGGALVASLQCWPLALHERGRETDLVLVGPIAVAPARQGEGFGRLITLAAIGVADRLGAPPLVLIGDPEFYGRFFGFSAAATGGWTLPGPWEPRRLLARNPVGVALPAEGRLGPPGAGLAKPRAMAERRAMPSPEPLPDLTGLGLAEIAALAAEKKLPPVEQWHPAHCGDSAMRIARDGTWFHEGSPIGRSAMVRLFSTILRREPDGGFVLVTPAEKLDIAVEDAPFIAVELKSEGAGGTRRLAFRLNTGDLVVAGPDHPLRFEARADGPHPYLHVRGGLDALVARAVYYELAELALADEADPPGLWSDGAFFPIEAA